MAKRPAPRKVFHSTPNPDGNGWIVQEGGKVVSKHRKQETAQNAAVKAGRAAEAAGGLGQAVFHKANGEIAQERTYGEDPERTPG